MKEVVFVTGNAQKAQSMAKLLGYPLTHQPADLTEIQSLDLKEIAKAKAIEAFKQIKKPVVVEDVSFELSALGGLPGPFIKFFVDQIGTEAICNLITNGNRKATARCVVAYYDGHKIELFEGHCDGTIAERPIGAEDFGWDNVFIPNGYNTTRADLPESDKDTVYKIIKPLEELKRFLDNL